MTQLGKKKVLILRPDNIGDIVLFSGCLKHIRKLYPGAKITLAVKKHIINLVQLCPHVDKVLAYQEMLPWWLWLYSRIPQLYRLLRMIEKTDRIFGSSRPVRKVKNWLFRKKNLEWDILICPVRPYDEQLLWFIKSVFAKEKLGIEYGQSELKDNIFPPPEIFSDFMELEKKHFWQHELETNWQFIQYLTKRKLSFQEVWPEFWFSKTNRDFSTKIPGGFEKGFTIGLVISASAYFKEWPFRKYGELLSCLPLIGRTVLFGGASDMNKTDLIQKEIVRKRPEIELINLTGRTTLRQLVTSISRCNLVVSVDTGALHIATALKIPTVGIMGGGHFGRFYPWGNPKINRVVNIAMDCYHCNWCCFYHDYRCVRDIPVSMVARECNAIFEELRNKLKEDGNIRSN